MPCICVTTRDSRLPYDVVGSSHNGSSTRRHYFNGNLATPGIPADGMNKFLRQPGELARRRGTASPGT